MQSTSARAQAVAQAPERRVVHQAPARDEDVEVRLLAGEGSPGFEAWRRGVTEELDEDTGALRVRLVPPEDENAATPLSGMPAAVAAPTSAAPHDATMADVGDAAPEDTAEGNADEAAAMDADVPSMPEPAPNGDVVELDVKALVRERRIVLLGDSATLPLGLAHGNVWEEFDSKYEYIPRVVAHGYGTRSAKSELYIPNALWDVVNKDGKPGLVGLSNLGNTCYMNSVLQCVAHTPGVLPYFLSRKYLAELNRDNPLGMSGELAESFGRLVQTMWRPKLASTCPRSFKEKLSRFAPRFTGYHQQDSQEFLAFLLDGLHEDLNRVRSKPYTEVKDSDGRPDVVVCAEQWDLHRRRNDSVVVDAFQGQYRSELTCNQCGCQSVTFDPFMYLTVPIPTPETQRFVDVVVCDSVFGRHRAYRVQSLSLSKQGKVGELRQGVLHMARRVVLLEERDAALRASSSSQPAMPCAEAMLAEHLLFAEVCGGRVVRFLEDDSACVPEHKGAPAPPSGGFPGECIACYRLPSATAVRAARALLAHDAATTIADGADANSAADAATAASAACHPGIALALVHNRRRAKRSILGISSEATFAPFGVPQLVVASPVCFSKGPGGLPELVNNMTAEKLQAGAGLPAHPVSAGLVRALAPYAASGMAAAAAVLRSGEPPFELTQSNAKGLGMQALHSAEGDAASGGGGILEAASVLPSGPASNAPAAMPPPSAIPGWTCGATVGTAEQPDGNDDEDDGATRAECPAASSGLAAFGCPAPTLLSLTWSASVAGEAPAAIPEHAKGAYEVAALDSVEVVSGDEAFGGSASGSASLGGSPEAAGLRLEACLDLLGRPEQLGEGEEWCCPRCKEHVAAYKKLDLYELPEVLVIHLKRFKTQKTGQASHHALVDSKINARVEYPLTGLDLQRHLHVNMNPRSPATVSPVYDLFAVSNHVGIGTGGGHYTTFATLGNGPDDWHSFDDSHVTLLSDPEKEVVSDKAYLLFYARRGGPNAVGVSVPAAPPAAVDDSTASKPRNDGLDGIYLMVPCGKKGHAHERALLEYMPTGGEACTKDRAIKFIEAYASIVEANARIHDVHHKALFTEINKHRVDWCWHCREMQRKCTHSHGKLGACLHFYLSVSKNKTCVLCNAKGDVDLDHLPNFHKVKELSAWRWWSAHGGLEAMILEWKKCECVCRKCHMIRTKERWDARKAKSQEGEHAESQPSKRARTSNQGRNNAREFVDFVKLKIGACDDCGLKVDPKWTLVHCFAHIDAGTKVANISELINTANIDTIVEEIGKCRLLCQNCHQKETTERQRNHSVTLKSKTS